MNPTPRAFLASLVILSIVGPCAAIDEARAENLAFELVRSSSRTYEAARAAGVGGSTREEVLLVRLFNMWSGSRTLFDMVESPDTSRRRLEDTLLLLNTLSQETDGLVERLRGYEGVQRAWGDTEAALSLLLQEYQLTRGTGLPTNGTGGERGSEEGDRGDSTAAPAPRDLSARISATDWLGGFTPDLEVRGVFEGKDMVKAVVEVRDDSGDLFHSNESELTRQIQRATEGFGRGDTVRVDWRIRLDDDDLASGENRIVVILENGQGERVEAETKIKKRLF